MGDARLDIFNRTDFVKRVREHFVSISGRCVELDDVGNPIKEDVYSFSAFVIEIRGVWCLVTAGHIVNNVQAIMDDPRKRITSCGLADYFSERAVVKRLMPFPIADVHKIHVDQDGIDIAIIPLFGLFRESLKSNGVVPLPVAQWRGWSLPECEAYMILGLPAEQIIPIEATESRGPGHNVLLVLVPVEPCAVPTIEGHLNVPKFAAKVLDNENLRSVEGLSGGPIVGVRLKPDGERTYTCVAVQSSWLPESRIVLGTPVHLAVNVIDKLLEQHGFKNP